MQKEKTKLSFKSKEFGVIQTPDFMYSIGGQNRASELL